MNLKCIANLAPMHKKSEIYEELRCDNASKCHQMKYTFPISYDMYIQKIVKSSNKDKL